MNILAQLSARQGRPRAPRRPKTRLDVFSYITSPSPHPARLPLSLWISFLGPPSVGQQGQVQKRLVRRNTRHATLRHAEKAKMDPVLPRQETSSSASSSRLMASSRVSNASTDHIRAGRGASSAMDPGRLFVSFSANSTYTPPPLPRVNIEPKLVKRRVKTS
ncbi:hypothetical protein CGRA01v4_12913 [Colletotrichum graminicola]|nr:hypothetical protein CGRA01v4_12913 [Colletotrichum graminicola]